MYNDEENRGLMKSKFTDSNSAGDKWFQLGRIFSICLQEDKVVFAEECDYYFKEVMTKAEAIDLLEEAIRFINES